MSIFIGLLERGSYVILLKFNIIKPESYFHHPMAEQRLYVTQAEDTEEKLAIGHALLF